MYKKIVSATLVLTFSLSMLVSTQSVLTTVKDPIGIGVPQEYLKIRTTDAATHSLIRVPTDYETIGEAIEAADTGDTISVCSGTYHEHLIVNKAVTLIGEDAKTTIIDGDGTGTPINIKASNVKIKKFTMQNGGTMDYHAYGIVITGNRAMVQDNIIQNNHRGVWIFESTDTAIVDNVILNNLAEGITIQGDSNVIYGNTIKNNPAGAITYEHNNSLYHNNFINNAYQAFDYGMNRWDNTAEGNHWSDYEGEDLNGDGIGDTPYFMDLGTDYSPLIEPWSPIRTFDIRYGEKGYRVTIDRDSTVSSFNFSYPLGQITFKTTGPTGADGYCNVTIPKTLLRCRNITEWAVIVNNTRISIPTPVENATHTFLYFTYTHSTCNIQVRGTVVIGNNLPFADFIYHPENPTVSQDVQFTDTSHDPNGTIEAWSWDFGDNTTSTDENPIHKYSKNGTFTVTLIVTDNEGASDTTSAVITVLNRPPIAIFTESAETAYTGEIVTFNASSSYDPDDSIGNYFWDFGDGTNATGVIVDHSYADDGNYTVTLTVTDNEGAKDLTSKVITVVPASVDQTPFVILAVAIITIALVVVLVVVRRRRSLCVASKLGC